jgi:hypothetical protein
MEDRGACALYSSPLLLPIISAEENYFWNPR